MDAPDGLMIPIPSPEESLRGPEVLGTWHAAMSNVVGLELPHDLLAVWFYPAYGGVSLVGPASLAEDDLQVPLPSPRISRPQLDLLEEIILDAGYGSAVCVAARTERDDVGLVLLASFSPDQYDAIAREKVRRIARRISPTLMRLADPDAPEWQPSVEARVLDGLASAMRSAQSPIGFARGISEGIDRLVPHERLEILIPGASPEQCYRLSSHQQGALWSDASLIVPRDLWDASVLGAKGAEEGGAGGKGAEGVVVVRDAASTPGWGGWSASVKGLPMRSTLAARLEVGGRTVGYVLLGSSLVGMYDPHDAELLGRVVPALAARVEGLVQVHQLRVLRTQLGSANAVPNQLRRMSTVLATATDMPAALREFFAESTAILPLHRVRLALRATDPARVVMLIPGDARPLVELASTPATQVVAQVLAGEIPHGVLGGGIEVELVLPLRVSGQVTGALLLTLASADAVTRSHLALAQQVADMVAPWVETHVMQVRNAGLSPALLMPSAPR
jgi:GAF domain-containing protein